VTISCPKGYLLPTRINLTISSLEKRTFSVPTTLRRTPLEKLDIPRSLLNLLEKRGFSELGDFDSLSHVEFRRYIRNLPSPTNIVLAVDQAIEAMRHSAERMQLSRRQVDGPDPTNLHVEQHSLTNPSPSNLEHVPETETIYIPFDRHGQTIASNDVSVRLRNICECAQIRLLGQLHGRTLAEFSKLQNCGKKTVAEIRELVRRLQRVDGVPRAANVPPTNPNVLDVPPSAQSLALSELPMSVRLEHVLIEHGYETLGELNGLDIRKLLDTQNCGRKTVVELCNLVRLAAAGEYSPHETEKIGDHTRQVALSIHAALNGLDPRDREIFGARLFGRDGNPRTLEDVGSQFGITRERVRQIVRDSMKKIRRMGGPKLVRALEGVAAECERQVCPLTAELFTKWLRESPTVPRSSEFYIRVLDDLDQTIPAWPPGTTREGANDPLAPGIEKTLETLLRQKPSSPTAAEAFAELRTLSGYRNMPSSRFLAILRRANGVVVELSEPDVPRLRVARQRMKIVEFARPVLEESSMPLTPEVILERAKSRYGETAIVASARGAATSLTPDRQFFLLGPRSFGLRQHFRTAPARWAPLRTEFAKLLAAENRPVSTIEVVERHHIDYDGNSYELAQIIREDDRFIDLGRHLFALTEWGIQERERIKDLLPKVFEQAGHVLTVSQTLARLTRLRSVSPYSIANFLHTHSDLRSFGFGYYGLTSWDVDKSRVILADRTVVEKAVRRAAPPISFQTLCETFGIPVGSEDASSLWKTCARSPKLRRAPDSQTPETLLLHKAVSLEMALATIARALQRPAPAYELEWELRAKFGSIFASLGLAAIEERLARTDGFIRNAAGEFLLDTQADMGAYDVEGLRQATIESLLASGSVASSDELIERLEERGFDVSELSVDMLSSILRGANELQEIGHQRFRAK
jgi:Sigma-70, region 4/Bacterial RNA polymerase, alpha chain C terminal domain